MFDRSIYKASDWGIRFHQCPVRQLMGGGAAGVGKSLALMMDPILCQMVVEKARVEQVYPPGFPKGLEKLCREFPLAKGGSEGHALHMRREFPEHKENIARSLRMFKRLDPDAIYLKEEHEWEFPSGYRFSFGHCRDKDDHQKYLSKQYCVAKGMRVMMADGRFRQIETISPGELVSTLEGPRRVLATWDSGVKPCVEAVVRDRGEIVGRQVHPTTHPVLLWTNEQSEQSALFDGSQSGCRDLPFSPVWHDFESLLDGLPESPGSRVSRVDDRSDFATSCGERLALRQLPALFVPVVLSERALRLAGAQQRLSTGSDAPSTSPVPSSPSTPALQQLLPTRLWGQPQADGGDLLAPSDGAFLDACGVSCDETGTGTPTDLTDHCSSRPRLRGGRPLPPSGSDPGLVLPPGDAGAHSRAGLPLDGPSGSPSRSQKSEGKHYPHFYTGERRPLTEGVRRGTAELRFAGWFETWDLTVEGASHYITDSAVVSCQTHLGLDEAWEFEEEQAEQLGARVRSGDPILRLFLRERFTSNPFPGWVKKWFVDPCPEGNKELRYKIVDPETGDFEVRSRMFMPGKLSDNPDKDFVKDYRFTLLSKPAHMRNRYLYGDWSTAEGGYFAGDWNAKVHIIEPFKVPRDWPKFRAMDWGYRDYGVIGWFAMDWDGNLYCFYEFTFRLMKDEAVAKRVIEIEKEFGFWNRRQQRSRLVGVADTQLWEERGDSGKSKAQVFAENGVFWQPAEKGLLERHGERISMRLTSYDKTRPPGLMFFKNCKRCTDALPGIGVDANDQTKYDKKSPLKHWVDMIAYATARASRGPKSIPMDLHEYDQPDRDTNIREETSGGEGFGYG